MSECRDWNWSFSGKTVEVDTGFLRAIMAMAAQYDNIREQVSILPANEHRENKEFIWFLMRGVKW